MKENYSHLAFNRGVISKLGLGRIDLKRTALSAETQTNIVPRVLGSAMLRPGLSYQGSTKSDAAAVHIPFVFSFDDKAVIEFTNNVMRIRIDDVVLTRPSVSSAVTNGNFTTDLTGWTDSDDAGATSSWVSGALAMVGNSTGTAYCKRDQQVTVAVGDRGIEHALRITVSRGPVEIQVGSSQGGEQYFGYSLGTGVHSISFTPTNNFWIRARSRERYTVLINDINVESSGNVEITTGFLSADIPNMRYDQSGDIIFIACKDKQQKKIERRAERSWSWVTYDANQGPFLSENITSTTITPSALNGNATLTASSDLFESSHVGALFKITSNVQNVVANDISAENTFTDAILVTGITSSRIFTITIRNVSDSTITLQRSIETANAWVDVKTWTANSVETYDDDLDNQTAYYRIGVKTGDYGTDAPDLSLLIKSGSITGVCRITSVASGTSAGAIILKSFGSTTDASSNWAEGRWSSKRGYPSAVAFHEGRLFWAGKDRLNGSVSDSFYNFDPDYEGDAAPIDRSIGQGPVDNINWLSSNKSLLIGCEGSVKYARSSNLDEPLTSLNVGIKDIITQGAANIQAVKVDGHVIFVQGSGTRVYDVGFDAVTYDYGNIDLTAIVPEIGEPSITKIVVQRQPDTRIHCIRSDGSVALLVYDKIEDVKCWVIINTLGASGIIEDALVLPGSLEDDVYYLVKRTIGGATKRFWEKWTKESENKGGVITKLADSHIIYSGASSSTITGLSHLEGKSVVVWGNSKYLGDYTVSSGQITLSEATTWACVGLGYDGFFKSAKPALATAIGSSLLQKKFISSLGLLLSDTHSKGIKYGPDFNNLDDLPTIENGKAVTEGHFWSEYDEESFAFPGTWDTDARVCLKMSAPKPCTILAMVIGWNTNEKA